MATRPPERSHGLCFRAPSALVLVLIVACAPSKDGVRPEGDASGDPAVVSADDDRGDFGAGDTDSGDANAGDSHPGPAFELSAIPAMPPNWAAPRLLDGAYASSFQRQSGAWIRDTVAIVPPGSRLMIGPRYIGDDATSAPTGVELLALTVDGRGVDLTTYALLAPESYFFGTRTEAYYGRGSGRVFSYGIAMDVLRPGTFDVEATSLVEIDGSPIPWTDTVHVDVRPYVRNSFAAGSPAPALGQTAGKWVVPSEATFVANATVIPATGEAPIADGAVAILGEWIVAVGPEADFDVSAGPTVVDAQGGYVIPGLFNAHVHFGTDASISPESWLAAGITTLVDVGGNLLGVLSVREILTSRSGPQPDLLDAGPIIEAPGAGHQHSYGSPGFFAVSTPEEATAAATRVADWGANLVKVSGGDLDDSNLMTVAQLQAVVAVAHARGLQVMAHVTTELQLDRAIAAGVDTVTHIPPLSDQHIADMVAAGVRMVPTLSASWRDLTARIDDARRAFVAGVPLATGDDYPAHPVGLPTLELQYLEQAGLTPMQVIEASTRVAAEVAGVADVVGTIEVGKIADLVLLGSDPTNTLDALADVAAVVKRGRVYWP